jgi:hypothetical protein
MNTHYETAPSQSQADDVRLEDVGRFLAKDVNLLLLVTVVGGIVRWLLVRGVDFPAGDGGLLYATATALDGMPFGRFPFFPFNGWNVPYTQPPLAPVLVAFLTGWLDQPLMDVMLVLSLGLSIIQIPLVFLLARRMLGTKAPAITATVIFTLSPAVMSTMLGIEGITLGLALVWAMVTIGSAFRLMTQPSEIALLLTAAGLALTFLTQGETGVFALVTVILIALSFGRSRIAWLYLLFAGMLALVALMVWLGPVLALHGVGPYLSALGNADLFELSRGAMFAPEALFTGESTLPIFTMMGLLGTTIAFAKRQLFLPLWLLFSLVILGDQIRVLAVLPLAVLAAVALHQLIIPLLTHIGRSYIGDGVLFVEYYSPRQWLVRLNRQLFRLPLVLFLVMIVAYSGIGAITETQRSLDANRVSTADRSMINWVGDNLPSDAVVVLITPTDAPVINGWLSALTNLQNLTTVQGSGWAGQPAVETAKRYQACFNSDVACLDAVASEMDGVTPITHVIFPSGIRSALMESLERDPTFVVIYERGDTLIFERMLAPPTAP